MQEKEMRSVVADAAIESQISTLVADALATALIADGYTLVKTLTDPKLRAGPQVTKPQAKAAKAAKAV